MEKMIFNRGARVGSFIVETLADEALEGLECYRASHAKHKTPALIHVCDLRHSPPKREAFQVFKERAEGLQRLHVHALPALLEADINDGVMWIAFALPEGRPLYEHVCDHGPLTPSEGAALLCDIAKTLLEARSAGFHGMLESRAIFVAAQGKLRDVAHFGIASLCGISLPPSLYQPPEQRKNQRHLGERVDIFAAAALTWEAIFGDEPNASSKPNPFRLEGLADRIPNLRSVRADVPEVLADLLFRWTSHDADERPRTWLEALTEIEPIAALLSSSANAENTSAESICAESPTIESVMNDNDDRERPQLRESGPVRIRVLPPPPLERASTIPAPAPIVSGRGEPLSNPALGSQAEATSKAPEPPKKTRREFAIVGALAIVLGSITTLALYRAPSFKAMETARAASLAPHLRERAKAAPSPPPMPSKPAENAKITASMPAPAQPHPRIQQEAQRPKPKRDRFEPLRYLNTGMYRASRKD